MTAEIIQIRDYQTLDERLQRWCRMSDRLLAETLSEATETVPYGGQGIDGMKLDQGS